MRGQRGSGGIGEGVEVGVVVGMGVGGVVGEEGQEREEGMGEVGGQGQKMEGVEKKWQEMEKGGGAVEGNGKSREGESNEEEGTIEEYREWRGGRRYRGGRRRWYKRREIINYFY